MDKIAFEDDDKLDSPKVRAMAKELHTIKMERLEREKIDSLDDQIHEEKTKLRYRKVIDKIPKPVRRFSKGVANVAKGVAKKIQERQATPSKQRSSKTNSRRVKYVDRGPAPSFPIVFGGGSSQPRRSSKPHNILGMTNSFSNSLNRDLLNGQPPIKKKPHRTQQKTPRQKYLDLAQQEFNLLNSKNDPHRFRRKEIIRDYSRSTRKIKNVNRVMNR